MSRVGKKPVTVPSGVTATVDGQTVKMKGQKGELSFVVPEEVTVALEYDPPGGKLAALLAKLSGEEAGQQVGETLRRFKALMEAGEIPTTEGQPVGEPQRSLRKKGKR